MTREELIEHQREEIKALKAANLDLQIHFDIMKAELDEIKACQWVNHDHIHPSELGRSKVARCYLTSIDEILENDWTRK